MGENSKIEWCEHTFNPWVGCTKLAHPSGSACDFCYAASWAKRSGHPELWEGERRRTTASNWQQPIKWNRAAAEAGRRDRVFCASLADVFDNQVPAEWRTDLWALIYKTPALDWLLLTKRPENIRKMCPANNDVANDIRKKVGISAWPWPNVWLGTTAEDQLRYDHRWGHLRQIPARVRFISYEPAIGAMLPGLDVHEGQTPDWIIAGGESGGNARAPNAEWFRNLRDDCGKLGIGFFFKQWGEYLPVGQSLPGYGKVRGATAVKPGRMKLHYGGTPTQMPKHAFAERGVEFASTVDGRLAFRVGKKAAGRLLDGCEHNAFPRAIERSAP